MGERPPGVPRGEGADHGNGATGEESGEQRFGVDVRSPDGARSSVRLGVKNTT